MRLALMPHHDTPCPSVAGVDVEIARRARTLTLRFAVVGAVAGLRLPPVSTSRRADELWKHTCFEAFVRPALDEAYYEFNFAPSTHWAAYRFSGYRQNMALADEIAAPEIETALHANRYELRAMVALPSDAAWRVALSAVIEEASGAKSYWALAHPPGKPDFHHADSFVLELPPDP
jgi:hypothetical protein